METKNVNGDVLSNEVFETKEELMENFVDAMEDNDVATIKVTKEVTRDLLTNQRKNFITKKLRKLERKHKTLVEELSKG